MIWGESMRMTCDWPMQPNNSLKIIFLPRFRPWLAFILLSLATMTCEARNNAPAWAAMGSRLQTLNQQILADRERVNMIAGLYLSSDDISEEDFNWLKLSAEKYGLEPRQRGDRNFFNALLSRMDIVPPSLALAQGWLEYGWRKSTTRFPPACVPRCTTRNRIPAPEDMHAWVHAINTEPQGAAFRAVRSQLRLQNRKPTALALIAALEPLTSERAGYSQRIRAVIKQQKLDRWDP